MAVAVRISLLLVIGLVACAWSEITQKSGAGKYCKGGTTPTLHEALMMVCNKPLDINNIFTNVPSKPSFMIQKKDTFHPRWIYINDNDKIRQDKNSLDWLRARDTVLMEHARAHQFLRDSSRQSNESIREAESGLVGECCEETCTGEEIAEACPNHKITGGHYNGR